jgi:hypothetical protein
MHTKETWFKSTFDAVVESCSPKKHLVTGNKKVAIVAGHFMLLYDKKEQGLMPCIWQELEDQKLIEFAKMMSGNFPVESLKLAINLKESYAKDGFESKLVLVVNDHIFQSKRFQDGIQDEIKNKGGELRKKFYLKFNFLPKVFTKIINDAGKGIADLFLDNSDDKRTQKSILPKKTIFFSEQFLQNRYENYRLPKLLKAKLASKSSLYENKEVYLNLPDIREGVCLTENGNCGCVGLTIEFIAEMYKRERYTIFLLMPNECAEAVNVGITSAMNLFKKEALIFCISNMGGMGKFIDKGNYENIKVVIHKYAKT